MPKATTTIAIATRPSRSTACAAGQRPPAAADRQRPRGGPDPGRQQREGERDADKPEVGEGLDQVAVGLVGLQAAGRVAQAGDAVAELADALEQRMAPTSRPCCQYSGPAEPSWVSRPALSRTTLLGLVSECQACEIWPNRPRLESGEGHHGARGRGRRRRAARSRCAGGSVREMTRVHRHGSPPCPPGPGSHEDPEQHGAESVPGGVLRGERDVVTGEVVAVRGPRRRSGSRTPRTAASMSAERNRCGTNASHAATATAATSSAERE